MIDSPTILLVSADEATSTIFSYHLGRCGFIANTANDGNNALSAAEQVIPKVIIVDDNINSLGHDKLTATEICTIFRTKPATRNAKIFLVTKTPDKYVHLKGVNIGVDDVIKKPILPSDMVARIKGLFTQVPTQSGHKYLEYKDLKLNAKTYKVTRNGRQIHLGPTEFKILQCLMELPSRTLTREHIMKQVWGIDSQVEPRTIDVHINRLRAALKNDNEKEVTLIRTVRSEGYCLSAS